EVASWETVDRVARHEPEYKLAAPSVLPGLACVRRLRSMLRRLAVRSRLHVRRRSCPHCRSRVRRKFSVQHRSGRLPRVKILFLLRLQRTTGVFFHRRRFLLIGQFFLRWWGFGHQRGSSGRRTAIHFALVRRWRRMRNIGRGRTLISDWRRSVRRADFCIVPVGRLGHIPSIRCRSVGNILIRPHGFVGSRVLRRKISDCRCRLSGSNCHWRMLDDLGPFSSHGWTGWRAARCYGARSGIDLRMWNYLRACELLWIDLHHIARHRLGAAKCVRINCGRRYGLIAVVDVVDVGNVGDVDVAHIGNVHLLQIDITVVIPREEWLARAKREPGSKTAHTKADRKSRTAYKRDERRPIDRRNRYRSGQPSPARPDLYPAPVVEGSK